MKLFLGKIRSKAHLFGLGPRLAAILGAVATLSCGVVSILAAVHFIRLEPQTAFFIFAVALLGCIAGPFVAWWSLFSFRSEARGEIARQLPVPAVVPFVPPAAVTPAKAAAPSEPSAKSASQEDIFSVIGVDYMNVALSVDLTQNFFRSHTIEGFRESLQEVRKEIARETGVVVSGIHVRDDATLKPFTVEISIRDEVVSTLTLMESRFLAIGSEEVLDQLEGDEAAGLVYHFTSKWIPAESVENARVLGALVFPHISIILSLVGQCARDYLWKSFGRQEFHTLINHLRKQHPAVIDAFDQLHVPYDVLHKVWRGLLLEGIWPRDPILVLEIILQELEVHRASHLWLNNSGSWGRSINEYQEVIAELYNPTKLIEAVRKALVPNQLRRTYGSREQTAAAVKYIVFSSGLTKKLYQLGDREHWSLLDVALCEQLVRDLNQEYLQNRAEFIKCDPSHRVTISQLLSAMHCKMSVFARDELPRDLRAEHYATYSESGLEISAELPDFPSDVIFKQFQTKTPQAQAPKG